MSKRYGFSGTLKPSNIFKEIDQSFPINNILISVKDGSIDVSYDDEKDELEARIVAQNLVNSWIHRNNIKIEAIFNTSWKVNEQGRRDINLMLTESIKIHSILHAPIVTTKIIQKKLKYVVKQSSSSYDFTNDVETVRKSLKDSILQKALKYYAEEVVEDDHPLYGIFKALEVITKSTPNGRQKLASLVNQNKTYVSDVMETANFYRHGEPTGICKLTENECKDRARKLIEAYANSI